jgi:opacity protein-like surface antigen
MKRLLKPTAANLCAIIVAGVVSASSSLQAADLRQPPITGTPELQGTHWPHRQFYVRGDIGVGSHSFEKFSQPDLVENGGSFIQQSIGDTVYVGAGIGWQVSSRFRFDFTGEYRTTAQVKGMDNLTGELLAPAGELQANTLYQGNVSAFVGLANAYIDLFSSRGFTPYVGAGIGFANVKMSNFTTSSTATFIDAATGAAFSETTAGVSASNTQTNFAWAIMAGTSYDLSPNAKLDLGYRYLNLGSSATTSTLNCVCGTTGQPLKISDLEAHEFRIGIRWMLGNDAIPVAYQPLK